MEQVILKANKGGFHGNSANKVIEMKNKDSIFDPKSKKHFKRKNKYDLYRGDSAYAMDCRYDWDEICDWGDMQF